MRRALSVCLRQVAALPEALLASTSRASCSAGPSSAAAPAEGLQHRTANMHAPWRRRISSTACIHKEPPSKSAKDLYMAFTCGKCDTRAVKGFTRQAYEKGLVIVTCPGCEVKHLVADNLGWFGDNGNVEAFVRERGGEAVRISADGTVEYDAETLQRLIAGRSSGQAAAGSDAAS